MFVLAQLLPDPPYPPPHSISCSFTHSLFLKKKKRKRKKNSQDQKFETDKKMPRKTCTHSSQMEP